MNAFKVVLFATAVFTSLSCALLLFRGYKQRHIRLLRWSALCFAGLTLNNVVLFLDLVIYPAIDLRAIRVVSALVGMLFLLYAFIWDTDEMGRPL